MTIVKEYLLSEKENPYSRERSNGVSFWGYPERRGGLDAITCIVVHTTESPIGTPAMNVASWQAYRAQSPSSYHVLADPWTLVRTLEDEAVAFHAVGMNTRGLGLSFVQHASDWGAAPERETRMLKNAAWQAAKWVDRYGIPLRWLSKAQADRGEKGFIRHSTADPSRRSDPGRNFPAHEFFALIVGALTTDEEETTMKRLVHIGQRGGTAYEVVPDPQDPGAYALRPVPSRGVAEVITGSGTWGQETVILSEDEADRLRVL